MMVKKCTYLYNLGILEDHYHQIDGQTTLLGPSPLGQHHLQDQAKYLFDFQK